MRSRYATRPRVCLSAVARLMPREPSSASSTQDAHWPRTCIVLSRWKPPRRRKLSKRRITTGSPYLYSPAAIGDFSRVVTVVFKSVDDGRGEFALVLLLCLTLILGYTRVPYPRHGSSSMQLSGIHDTFYDYLT